MARYDFGNYGAAGDRPTAYTDGYVYYDFTMGSPRLAADGTRPGIAIRLEVVANGRFSNRSAAASLDNLAAGYSASTSGNINLPQGSSATTTNTFYLAGVGFYPGHPVRVRMNVNGSFYYDRNSAGPGSVITPYGSMAGALEGCVIFIEAPLPPAMLSAVSSADGKSATVRFQGNSDTGGTSITGWTLQRSDNSTFTAGVVNKTDADGTETVTGLTPGKRYYWRAAGRNWPTDWAATTGPWSAPISSTQALDPGAGKRFNGSSFVMNKVRRFNGSAWADSKGRRFNGSSWVDLS